MSVDYKAYLLIGYEIDHDYYEKHCKDEETEPYLLSPNYYYEADKCYFGKVISEVDAGHGTTIDIDANTYSKTCSELFEAKSKIDGATPLSMPYPNVYLICAVQ